MPTTTLIAHANFTSQAAACGDSKLRVWDVRAPTAAAATLEGSRHGPARCVALDGEWLAGGGADGTVRVYDLRTLRPLKVRHV
jgi:WD40 repeat protein